MKVKTNYVPEGCDYLTVGKVYEAKPIKFDLYYVVSDDGEGCNVSISDTGCAHLDFYCWEIVE